MSDNPYTAPKAVLGDAPSRKLRAPIRWAIAAISLILSAIVYIDIEFRKDFHRAYFRDLPLEVPYADYACLTVCAYFFLVAISGRWRLFPRGK